MKTNSAIAIRWLEISLFSQVMALLLTSTWCYDPCPESYQATEARFRAYDIPETDLENAFQQAEQRVNNKLEWERRLVRRGHVLNTRVRSAESASPQAYVTPEVRDKELRQRRFQEASIILTKEYQFTPDQVCCILPKFNLSSPSAAKTQRQCLEAEQRIWCDPSCRYRTADGTCNNLKNPTWGSALSCFYRLLPAVYSENEAFRKSVTGRPLPHPRILSLNINSHQDRPTDCVNHLYMFYGQLVDHDVTFTPSASTGYNKPIECCKDINNNHPECAPILISPYDPYYSKYGVSCLNFVRAAICDYCKPGPRTPINQMTAFVDASFIYGNNEKETNQLRDPRLPGSLRVQKTKVGDLPPVSYHPLEDLCSDPKQNLFCFQTGDFRANQNPGLISLHTLFVREHNRVARALRKMNRKWNEQKIFQEARKIVGAEVQGITYGEYLETTLGKEKMSSFGLKIFRGSAPTKYDENLNPGLVAEFSGAAFRFGHTFINSWIAECPGRKGHKGYLLRDTFNEPFLLYRGELDPLMRGATRSPAQQYDRCFVPDITNYMYRVRENGSAGFDLPAFNIQRGRDLGLQPYIELVRFCTQGKTDIGCFDDLHEVMIPENVEILRRNYRDVRDIDLFEGIVLEKRYRGALIGPTAICIIGRAFNRLKYGDRFYFEHNRVFTPEQRQELKKSSLANILCDNSGIKEIQGRAMLFPSAENPLVLCDDLPQVDLRAWREL